MICLTVTLKYVEINHYDQRHLLLELKRTDLVASETFLEGYREGFQSYCMCSSIKYKTSIIFIPLKFFLKPVIVGIVITDRPYFMEELSERDVTPMT